MPVPTSNIAPNKCAATCNGYMQSSLSQWGIFLFFFFVFPQTWLFLCSSASEPLRALCNLFFLFLGSEELAAAQFLQSREPEATCNTSWKCSYSPAPTRQSGWSQLTTICSFLIHLNTSWTPLNFPTALLEDTTHFDKCKPEAVFLSVHKASWNTQHCKAAEQNPLFFSDHLLTGSALLSCSRSTQCRCSSKYELTYDLNSSS